jgi:NDP-4-keto-2,6-dideoxyhexose 3-C-methyltransferase
VEPAKLAPANSCECADTPRAIGQCRICGSKGLRSVINLGQLALTGVFPRTRGERLASGPLELVRCSGGDGACGLVQLRHTYEPTGMYGANYGYRSSLNRSMVEHLSAKVAQLLSRTPIHGGDVVLDIGSNDGTTLSFYPQAGAILIGMDPTASKFAKHYRPHIRAVPDFFSAHAFLRESGNRRAKIVTSIAMFYDLDRPLDFARDVFEVLEDDGIWHFEQSYLPSMLSARSYDTICHEHIEYYALEQIRWMMDRVGFSIVDVSLNDINGGSFAVTVAKSKPGGVVHAPIVDKWTAEEHALGLPTSAPFERFAENVSRHRTELRSLLQKLKGEGKRIFGMGASTKGNVLLQYCGIGPDLVECIADVNEDKFGCFTPGTEIPIVSEADAIARGPDVFLVLPWHFRAGLVKRAAPLFLRGIRLLFPLPSIEFVASS